MCIYKYDPDTGNKTLIGKADSWKVDGANIYYTRGLIKNISEPGTYVITCTFAFEMQEPLAAAVKVEAGDTAEGDTENTGGSKLLYFRDVPSGHWAHDAVMDMVKIKLFNGTTEPDEKGAALFEPDRKMTYAQFIAVVTRYICPDYVEKYMYLAAYDGWWYKPYCSAAVEAGISDESGYDQEMYTLPVTRERMAKILVKACNKSGEGLGDKKYTDFPDYDKVSPEYRDYVAVAYAEGLLCGVNDAGKFDPKGTLTRAQAATVLYRLVDPSARVEI